MARTRSGEDLINDAYARSDLESAADRHSRVSVLRYVNQGCAALYDLLIEARGPAYYRATPQEITTAAGTTRYALNATFYRLISARVKGTQGFTLDPFRAQDEPWLRAPMADSQFPSHYEIQQLFIELLPLHRAGEIVVVNYIPFCPVLADSGVSLFDGINGWEEYVVCFAAKCMATKDEEWDLVRELRSDMASLASRISKLAPGRDAFRAERVKNVRGSPLGPRILRGR